MVKKLAVVIVLFMVAFIQPVEAASFFPLEDLRPGMTGSGRTVVQGSKIEEFDVEVIGVVPQSPPTPALVMVRVSGEAIDKSGGIAAGMSGSPIYIDNRLLGAIGYGYAYTDHRVGLVTPAERMLEIINGLPTPQETLEVVLPEGLTEMRTPLMVGGISGRALEYLEERLSGFGLNLVSGLAGSTLESLPHLQPGSAFGAQLLRGDFQAVAFGTVTHIDDERFVGFGHPFLHRGEVNYFVTPATVHYTMANLQFPFKVASAGDTVGALLQDRAAGVGGVIGLMPDYLPITIDVEDRHRQRQERFRVETVTDEALIMPLAMSSVYQAIDSTLDRVGRGTAYVRLELVGDNLGTPLIRDNMFFSDADIAVWALYDLMEGLDLLLGNRLQQVPLSEIKISIIVEQERRTAQIERAIPRSFRVKPGTSTEVEVLLRPFRGEVASRVLRIDIPKDTLPGPLTVTVRPGGAGYYSVKPTVHTTWWTGDDEHQERETPTAGETLDKLVDEFVRRERNNEIVAEFYPFIDSYPAQEEAELVTEEGYGSSNAELDLFLTPMTSEPEFFNYGWNNGSNEPQRVRLTTQYVIEGMATFDLEVLP